MSIFRVYVDGQIFYHPHLSKLAITEATVSEDAENIDSFALSAPYNHPYIDFIRPMASVIQCKKRQCKGSRFKRYQTKSLVKPDRRISSGDGNGFCLRLRYGKIHVFSYPSKLKHGSVVNQNIWYHSASLLVIFCCFPRPLSIAGRRCPTSVPSSR